MVNAEVPHAQILPTSLITIMMMDRDVDITWAHEKGSRDGAVVRALTSHQCGLGSTPGPGDICGLSFFLVLVFASRGFSPGTPVFPSPKKPTILNSNSIQTQWTRSHLVDVPLLIPFYFILK